MPLLIKDRFFAYAEPSWFLTIGLYGCILALIQMVFRSPGDIFELSKVKDAVFAQFWYRMGPIFAENDNETAVPGLVSKASGVVLELGPGIGSQLPRYDTAKISKVYGVEPNLDLHQALRQKIKAIGLSDIYDIVACGIEDTDVLEKHGIAPATVDTVLSVQVLCSVPEPDRVLRRLYTLMKPGAQFLVYEHVISSDMMSRMIQSFYNIFWPFFVGNCHLNRNTQKDVMQAGSWEKIELSVPKAEDAWAVFPRIQGQLWKEKSPSSN